MKSVVWLSVFALMLACSPTVSGGGPELQPDLLPAWTMPPDAQPVGGGGGGSDTAIGREQDLKTDLNLDELYQYYAAQLEAAQWHFVSKQSTADSIMSTWDVTGPDGRKYLGVLEVHYGTPDFSDAYAVKLQLSLSY